MNVTRRDFLRMMGVSATSYFFLGGILRPDKRVAVWRLKYVAFNGVDITESVTGDLAFALQDANAIVTASGKLWRGYSLDRTDQ